MLANAGAMTLTVTLPDGTVATPGFTNPSTGRYVPGVLIASQIGAYVAAWVGTGVNAAAFREELWVSDVAWAPGLSAVAKYVPARTVPTDTAPDDPLNTFTTATTPTAAQVDALVFEAVGWVTTRVGTVVTALHPQAAAAAAMRAAGLVEQSYPVRDADVNTAQQWLALAAQARDELDAANAAAGGVDVGEVLPVYSFPTAVGWGDSYL